MFAFKNLNTIVKDFKTCLYIVPLPILSLMLYAGLKSTVIFEGGLHQFNGSFHPAYFGWYDLVLGYSLIFSFVSCTLKPKLQDLVLGLIVLFMISASWLGTYESDRAFIVDGLICFLRFFLTYLFAKSLANRVGNKVAESVLIVLYGVLGANAILWYTLQFGDQNRLAASAMTSPSFGQISALMCLLFYSRKHYIPLIASCILLILTFSRTSLLLFLLMAIVQNRQLNLLKIVKYLVGFVALVGIAIVLLIKYGGAGTQVVLASRFSLDELSNLNGRSDMWAQALDLIQSGQIPMFGVGFHMAPLVIVESNLKYLRFYDVGFYIPPHFHNIIVEYIIGLGLFSLVIFAYFLVRIWQTFKYGCNPAFSIFSFFFLSQTLDYTFNAPKEIILFSLMLGFAEHQWQQQKESVKEPIISRSVESLLEPYEY